MEKDVLNSYSDEEITDEEIEEMLINYTIRYYIIIKSEKEAIKILKDNNQAFFNYQKDFKSYYFEFIEYAKRRGITLSKDIENVEISDEDILERIIENKESCIALINRYSSGFRGYLGNGVFEIDENLSINENEGVKIRIQEIENLYEQIINNFEATRKHTK